MKVFSKKNSMRGLGVFSASISIFLLLGVLPSVTQADETCQSPYMAKISGQEDFEPGPLAGFTMAASFINAVINVWPTTVKLGRGSWMTIPLEGDNAGKISSVIINY